MLQSEVPRVTGALRAYTGAYSGAENSEDDYDPEAQREALRRKRKKRQGDKSTHGVTWDVLNSEVNKYEKFQQGDVRSRLSTQTITIDFLRLLIF